MVPDRGDRYDRAGLVRCSEQISQCADEMCGTAYPRRRPEDVEVGALENNTFGGRGKPLRIATVHVDDRRVGSDVSADATDRCEECGEIGAEL